MSFLSSHNALLRRLVLRACMWCWLRFSNICSHVYASEELQIGHVIEGEQYIGQLVST